jgi:hypothetical protein
MRTLKNSENNKLFLLCSPVFHQLNSQEWIQHACGT